MRSFNIVLAATAALVGIAATVPQARAAFTITIDQVGGDVVATGSGSINTAALNYYEPGSSDGAFVFAQIAVVVLGLAGTGDTFVNMSGPAAFGTGASFPASFSTGDTVGIVGLIPIILVPAEYVSGAALADTATWLGASLSDLGLAPGTYIWTWGSEGTADSFTVQIDPATAPEPASITLLAAPAALALLRRRNRRRG